MGTLLASQDVAPCAATFSWEGCWSGRPPLLPSSPRLDPRVAQGALPGLADLPSPSSRLGKFAVFIHAKMAELQVRDLSLKLQGIPGHVFLLQLLPGQHAKHQFLLRARTE